MSPTKTMRWVSFIQGVCWSWGTLTIDEARQHNYAILNGGKEPQQ